MKPKDLLSHPALRMHLDAEEIETATETDAPYLSFIKMWDQLRNAKLIRTKFVHAQRREQHEVPM